MMPEIIRFEEAFTTFIDIIYHKVFSENKWKYDGAQRQENYQTLFDLQLALLAALNIAYDEFIEQELYAWSIPSGDGNPLALPFTEAFLPIYADKAYKASFIIICLQSKEPKKDISAALIQACYHEVHENLAACFGISTWLEFLGDYPNLAAVKFIEYILPYVNDDWYGQDLAIHLPRVLQVNPGPAATALMAQWVALEAKLEAARRL